MMFEKACACSAIEIVSFQYCNFVMLPNPQQFD